MVTVTRVEKWGLVLALVVLLGVGAAFAVAFFPRAHDPSLEADDGPSNPNVTYRANQAVEAWHDGRWYPAHIHSASGARYFITYDNFSISWHEWVTARRLRRR